MSRTPLPLSVYVLLLLKVLNDFTLLQPIINMRTADVHALCASGHLANLLKALNETNIHSVDQVDVQNIIDGLL